MTSHIQFKSRGNHFLKSMIIDASSNMRRLVLIPVLILVGYFYSDPEALRLLIKLYIERSHSVWKEPEVSSLELGRGAAVT